MKNTVKVTFCAFMAALSAAFMLLSYFPYLTYAIPAVAGLFMMIVVIEINLRWALGTFAAGALLVLIFAEPEAKLMYVCLFGYYPILKGALERIQKTALEWILKFAVFNAAVLLVYVGLSFVFDMSFADMGELGKYGGYVLLFAGNVVFLLYDIAISRIATFYMFRLHPKIQRLIK